MGLGSTACLPLLEKARPQGGLLQEMQGCKTRDEAQLTHSLPSPTAQLRLRLGSLAKQIIVATSLNFPA